MKSKRKKYIIAIDGPAGSGKSTTALLLAQKLNFFYLDTGAMYRVLTWKAIQKNLDVTNSQEMEKLAKNTKIEFKKEKEKIKTFLDDENVSQKLNSPEVNKWVSVLSMHKAVRKIMVQKQKQIAQDKNIVVEGRDTTTVVFPQADLKIFLKADLEVRTERKYKQLKFKQVKTTLKEQERLIRLRDKIDQERKTSPLKISPHAVIIDTTHLTITQQVNQILKIFKEKIAV